MGPLWLINAVLPGMHKRGNGKIVLVSSVGGGISQFPGKSCCKTCTRQVADYVYSMPSQVCCGCLNTTVARHVHVLQAHAQPVTKAGGAVLLLQSYVHQCCCLPFRMSLAPQHWCLQMCLTSQVRLHAGMRLADGMSKAAVSFLAKQLAAENTHTGEALTAAYKPLCCMLPLDNDSSRLR